jgi:hypothetical protein
MTPGPKSTDVVPRLHSGHEIGNYFGRERREQDSVA